MVNSLGGLAQKRSLVRLGATDRMLTSAVRRGEVHRARQGWYSTIAEQDPLLRAARIGGRLTGLSAMKALGAWSWNDGPLHVSVPRSAGRLRDQWNRFNLLNQVEATDVVVHWDDVDPGGDTKMVSMKAAMIRVVLDEPFEVAVSTFDWAFKSGLMSRFDFEEIIAALPMDARMVRNWVDERCDSVLESITRIWLQLRGFRVVSQVRVGTVEAIDLVVEEIVAVEVDGKEHHLKTFETDRRKDVSITIEGRHPLRPSYSMVRFEFPRLEAAIVQAIVARHANWTVENSGSDATRAVRGRRLWRLLDGTVARIPEFPPGRGASQGMKIRMHGLPTT